MSSTELSSPVEDTPSEDLGGVSFRVGRRKRIFGVTIQKMEYGWQQGTNFIAFQIRGLEKAIVLKTRRDIPRTLETRLVLFLS